MDKIETLERYFGHKTFRPLQDQAIDAVLEGHDTLVVLPTGGGKSLCYQLPALMLSGLTVVISPLISLMKDQIYALQERGIIAATLNSSLGERLRRQVIRDVFSGHIKLLYLSPETLMSPVGQDILNRCNLSLIAVDEAHCISQWGHDFRPEYAMLNVCKEMRPEVPLIALTATADEATRRDIMSRLSMDHPTVFIGDFDRPNLYLEVRRGYNKSQKLTAIQQFINDHQGGYGIIYCNKRSETEMLSSFLNDRGYRALPYHADMSNKDREIVHHAFLNSKAEIVCATVAFGMGIDKPDIRWVVHYNMPKNVESYYQEIGRAGRDGDRADTLLFYSYNDMFVLDKMIANKGSYDLYKQKMEYMKRYCEASVCRRRILLSYFGQPVHEDCHKCDVCLSPKPEQFDGTILAQKALSAVMRTHQMITMEMVIDILRGSRKMALMQKGYHYLPTYGVGSDLSAIHWREYIYQMIQSGLLSIDYAQGSVLKVTSIGEEVLYGRESFSLTLFKGYK